MLRNALLGKIHQATVTHCDPEYSGSVTIDQNLLDAAGIMPNEKVLVADCESGARFETYVFRGERGSGTIGINGAAAKLSAPGNRVIIIAFCTLESDEFMAHRPRVVICNEDNSVAEVIEYEPAGAMATV